MADPRALDANADCWEVRMLGGLLVNRGSRRIAFRTKKTAGVLAYLVFHGARPVAKDVLVGLFWPDCDPAKGRQSLRMAISSLRAEMANDGNPSPVHSDRDTVWIDLDQVTCDAHVLQRCLDLAERESDRDARIDLLRRACEPYVGPLLAGYGDSWIIAQALELEERFAQAVIELAQERMGRGEHAEAVQSLRRAISICSDREDLHVALLRVYRESGQVSAALKQYEELERMLDDNWGEAPSDEAARVMESLSSPEPRTTPVARPTRAVVAAEPSTASHFYGRSDEIAELADLLLPSEHRCRLVTLVGLGGSGKTRLAQRVTRIVGEGIEQRAWFVSLIGVREEQHVFERIMAALDLPQTASQDPVRTIAAALGSGDSLLVLDNLEQMAVLARRSIEQLLRAAPQLSILATSRVPLDAEGEHLFFVRPLPLPAGYHNLAELRASPSVALVVDAAQLVRPGFAISHVNAQSVWLLCQRLEGLPLALELAAARLGTLTPAQLLASLGRRSDLAALTNRARPEQQNLRAVVEWSVGQLEPDARQAFACISVCQGGFVMALAESLLGPKAHEIVTKLNRLSLVHWTETAQELRFAMLETVREIASEMLAELPDLNRRSRQAHFKFLEAIFVREQSSEAMQSETENLRSAIEAGIAGDVDAEPLWQAMGGLGKLVDSRGSPRSWITPTEQLFAATCSNLSVAGQIDAHLLLSQLHYGARDIAAAFDHAYAGSQLAAEFGDPARIVLTALALSNPSLLRGRYDDARSALERAMLVLDHGGELADAYRAECLAQLGWTSFVRGEEAASEPHFRAALEYAERSPRSRAYGLALAGLASAVGFTDHDAGQPLFQKAAIHIQNHGTPESLARLRYQWAHIEYLHGRVDQALDLIEQSLRGFADAGITLGQVPLMVAGTIFARADRPESAALCWQRSEASREQYGTAFFPAQRADYEREHARLSRWPSVDDAVTLSDTELLLRIFPAS